MRCDNPPMPVRLSRRKCARVAAIVVLCLLVQQLALAAYACPVDASAIAGSNRTAAMADCATHPCEAEPPMDALCQAHCAPDRATAAEGRSAGVPPLALPPIVFEIVALDCCGADRCPPDALGRDGAPPALASTRLLI